MQRFILVLLLVTAIFCGLAAQTYQQVLNGNEILFKIAVDNGTETVISEITVTEPAMLDGMVYRRVFFRYGFLPDLFIGYFREDAVEGQLFYRPIDGQDILVYDVSLSVGDTLTLAQNYCDGQNTNQAVLAQINLVEGRRVLVFDRDAGYNQFCESFQLIEGYGATASLITPYFFPGSPATGYAARLCHVFRDGEIVYPAGADLDLCELDVSDLADTQPATSLQVYPNPTRGALTVDGLLPGDELRILDGYGRPVLPQSSLAMLDLTHLPAGIYLVYLVRAGQPLAHQRVLKL